MTTTPAPPTCHGKLVLPKRSDLRQLVRRGALAGAIAAASTTGLAAVASAIDISLEADGTTIPNPAFAWWTMVGAGLGVVLSRLLRDRRRFIGATTVLTGLSLIPAIAAPDHTSTSAILVAAHLLAAAIIIPALSQQTHAGSGAPTTGEPT